MLAWPIYISFIGAATLALWPRTWVTAVRWLSLLIAGLGLLFGLWGTVSAGREGLVEITHVPWVASLGIEYYLAADGISMLLVLLTGVAAVAGVLFSWNVQHRVGEFFALYFALIGGVYGVFLSFDVFLLFVFYEIAIIPKYFLIAIWGSTNREYGAMKLALYSFAGSAMVLAGLIAAYALAGARTTNLLELAATPFPPSVQFWAFPLVFIGFGVLAGLWPFHTWAPTGHVAAPTAASMLLAGVVMKLGAYGCLRVAMTIFPLGLEDWEFKVLGFSTWRDVLAVMAAVGIVYGATVALVREDFKFVIGYSSVSHMGFVMLGILAQNTLGLSGAVLQMVSHGLIAGLLFAVVGRMVYDRAHTRQFKDLGPHNLNRTLPFATATFTIAGAASMGLPGFSGFVAELHVLAGAWEYHPRLVVLAGVGVLIGVAYTVRALQQGFFAKEADEPAVNQIVPSRLAPLEPITLQEKIGTFILAGSSLAVGLYPRPLLELIASALQTPLMKRVVEGGFSL